VTPTQEQEQGATYMTNHEMEQTLVKKNSSLDFPDAEDGEEVHDAEAAASTQNTVSLDDSLIT
jgi:hypothetical protein